MSDVFGQLVTPHEVTLAVEQHIRTWQRAYMDFVAETRGFSRRLPSIKSYRHTNDRPEKWPEDKLPCVVIVSEDAEPFDRSPEGVALDFPIAVAIIDSAREQHETNKLVQARAAALSLLFLGKPYLGLGEAMDWGGFTFTEDEADDKDRTLGVAAFGFTLRVPDALIIGPGPDTPTPEPEPEDPDAPEYPDLPTAETVEITVDRLDPQED